MSHAGKINLISILLLLITGAGIWWAVTFGPIYLDNLTVREAVHSSISAYNRGGDEAVREKLLTRLNRPVRDEVIGWHFEVDEYGQEKKAHGLGIRDEDIFIQYDEGTNILSIRLDYQRVVEVKPTSMRRTVHFVVEKQSKVR